METDSKTTPNSGTVSYPEKADSSSQRVSNHVPITKNRKLLSVSVAESITAGALSNTLCEEPGASEYFYGGMVCYSISSKNKLLGIDTEYAESANFANPFTSLEMAKAIANRFDSRIGISTTGYSLPKERQADNEKKYCKLDVKVPYAFICLYDRETDFHRIVYIEHEKYDKDSDQRIEKARMQSMVALRGKQIYLEYCT